MAYDRYPAPQERSNRPAERSNQPQYASAERDLYAEQPASRTRFYRDKRNGKFMGVCAGIADYTGFDVSLVRVCFLAALFMSGGSILPFYFIMGWVSPDKPIQLEGEDRQDEKFWQGVRAS